jgi:hypothetical protein
MLTQSDYQRLMRILQADRLANNVPLVGEKYESDIQFAIRIEKAIESLVENASS